MAISTFGLFQPRSVIPAGFTSTTTNLALSGAAQQILAANNFRKRIIICNQSVANFVDCNFGIAAVVGQGLRLGALLGAANGGMHYWDSAGGPCPTGLISVIGTAGQTVSVIEFQV